MKFLRLWFLVLLAVLLPVRGAMAATMPCMPAGAGGHAEVVVTGHVEAHAHHEGMDHGHDAQVHEPTPDPQPGHGHASQDKCNMCSASCSSPPLAGSFPAIDGPVVLSTATFPAVSAPAPTFQSGGQDRPTNLLTRRGLRGRSDGARACVRFGGPRGRFPAAVSPRR